VCFGLLASAEEQTMEFSGDKTTFR
jgi:hypothetical protein